MFSDWLASLRDVRAKAEIARRIRRLALGNPGDVKPVGQGVSELRIHTGPGYHVYFVQRGDILIILLCGGEKDSQDRDIRAALRFAKEIWMTLETRPFDPATYLDDPEAIVAYLQGAFADGDPAEITNALGVVARARGMSALAEETGLPRQSLYRALSSDGNPEFRTVLRVLLALGLRLHPERLPEPV